MGGGKTRIPGCPNLRLDFGKNVRHFGCVIRVPVRPLGAIRHRDGRPILPDIRSPVMDGYDRAKTLRRNPDLAGTPSSR